MNKDEIIEQIICELRKIAFANFSEVTRTLDGEEYAEFIKQLAKYESFFPAISQVKAVKDGVEIKFYDKLKAIELLGKYITRQGSDETESDFDNLIAVLQGKAGKIWEGGDRD